MMTDGESDMTCTETITKEPKEPKEDMQLAKTHTSRPIHEELKKS